MDTHTMLWLFNDDERLSEKAKEAIEQAIGSDFNKLLQPFELFTIKNRLLSFCKT